MKKDDNDTFIYTAKDGEITNLFVQEVKDGTAPVAPENGYNLGYWASSNSGNVCIAFQIVNDVPGENATFATRRQISALDLKAADFTLTVDGVKYTGVEVKEYGTSTTLGDGTQTGGYIKVNFGATGEVFASGDYFNAPGHTDTIRSVALTINGVNVLNATGVINVA